MPITVLGATHTSSPNIVHSINTPEEMLDLLPILHLKEILTLSPIIASFSITTPFSIFEYAPIVTFSPIRAVSWTIAVGCIWLFNLVLFFVK